jgi:hypothetical protein
MNNVELLLLGFVLGAAPSRETGRLVVAALGSWLNVEPSDVVAYGNATDSDPETAPETDTDQ